MVIGRIMADPVEIGVPYVKLATWLFLNSLMIDFGQCPQRESSIRMETINRTRNDVWACTPCGIAGFSKLLGSGMCGRLG